MKDIKGYEGLYAITPSGKIWAYPSLRQFKEGTFLKPWLIGNGYEQVKLFNKKMIKKFTHFLVHRLVAQAFIPNPNLLKYVNHKNGNRRDNRADNLEWVTAKQNNQHAWNTGLYTHNGTSHYLAKLDDTKVKNIRKLLQKMNFTQKQIAKRYKVSLTVISYIKLGKTWKHVI